MQRRLLPIVTALLICSLLLAACGQQEKAKDEDNNSLGQETTMEMTIAAMPSVDKIPVIVGESKGFFAQYGLAVNLENFQSPTDRNAALQAGEVDGVMSDMVADILYLDAGMDMVMTSLIQTDFMVVASSQSSITEFANITKSHKCGVALNTLMEYIADKAGPAQKVMVPDVMTRVEQVVSGDLDLTVVPEPYGSMAVERGAVKVGTSEDMGIYAALMLFPRAYLEDNKDAVTAFYRGYNDAVAYLEENGMADVLEDVTAKGEFPTSAQEIISQLKFKPIEPATAEQFKDVQEWMSQHPEFNGPYDYDFAQISDFSFLPQE